MFRFLESWRGRANTTANIDKVAGIERLTTLVALVTARIGRTAFGACPLDIAIGHKPLAFGAVCLEHGISIEKTLVQQCKENIMDDIGVVCCAGAGKQVEGNAQFIPALEELLVIFRSYFPGSSILLLGTKRNRRSMLVTPRYHEYLIAFETVVPCKNISGQVGSRYMSQMEGTIGIRPGDRNQNMFQ